MYIGVGYAQLPLMQTPVDADPPSSWMQTPLPLDAEPPWMRTPYPWMQIPSPWMQTPLPMDADPTFPMHAGKPPPFPVHASKSTHKEANCPPHETDW